MALTISASNWLSQLSSISDTRTIGVAARAGKRWQPPPMGKLKINVDASFCSSKMEAGLGVVVRNHVGEVVVSASKNIDFVSNSLYAEVHAILFRFEIALEYDIHDCILESDCLIAVKEIHKEAPVWWEGGVLIYEPSLRFDTRNSPFLSTLDEVHMSMNLSLYLHYSKGDRVVPDLDVFEK
ncbi:hypothetical protein COLO4_30428 [Corchorus olitorius]|uniref:RNase H type-1 domain-containing protein n=1 Tax=Corchorus olitorius TaxID=93759 RepID=A0A1R3H8K0_9ROSI|nr:hypothetical protein COLO4_30428 [Corchorus olitorius]